ncbi:virulence RhuM family protein [Desulfoglaeba alkanexedens]|uniref:Virulence RhuM family protein n=1 Tax=Desulfoglaeba alkanexedens ALDC TaxID=980445 RepID=A0A4P8L2Q9_9BACT|nr:virulence RhuM family protein [Desulfoglaeba alkanexedens]QCQ22119.1 virulence RhuM family protein [Desulfoglaeba alkanexedens ALDC]
MTILPANPTRSEILIYQTEDGRTRIQVRMEDETVWLTQADMAQLFQTTSQNITLHLKNIYQEGELDESATCKDFLQVQSEGGRQVQRSRKFYNLDAVISVGYRIKSHVATRFRQWATQRLREYIVKGFTLDDERLKQAGGGNYFDELLARIRDIRASEKVFWRKVLDIYATSIDYDPSTEMSRRFFQIVQNKMHWAAHGHTAAEIIAARADAEKPHMGLTSWTGAKPTQADSEIAKNYLTIEELDTLNRIVTIYLDFAELQALNRKPMYMKDWIAKLDEFLKVSERDILTHAGKISHEAAIEKARMEYEKFRKRSLEEPSPVERHFIEAVKEVKKLEQKKPRNTRKTRK